MKNIEKIACVPSHCRSKRDPVHVDALYRCRNGNFSQHIDPISLSGTGTGFAHLKGKLRKSQYKGKVTEMLMEQLSKKLRTAAALGLLSLAPLAASASILNFDFTTVGSGTLGASCGTSCKQLDLSGTTHITGLDSYFGGSTPTFTFTGLLNFVEQGPAFGGFGEGAAPGGGWSMSDGIGDSLSGFFLGVLSGTPSDAVRLGSFFYGVTGGSGLFGGAFGASVGPHSPFGGTFVGFAPYPGQYGEAGSFTVEVPEPSVIALFLAGLLAMGWTLRRQQVRHSFATPGALTTIDG